MDRYFKNRKMVLTGVFCIFLLVDFLIFLGASNIFWNMDTYCLVFLGYAISSVLVFFGSLGLYFFVFKGKRLWIGNLIILLGLGIFVLDQIFDNWIFEYLRDSFILQVWHFFLLLSVICFIIYLPLTLILFGSLWRNSSPKTYWIPRISLIVLAFLLLAFLFLGIGTRIARNRADREIILAKQQLQPLIEKLHAYHADKQNYPESLEEVIAKEELDKISKVFRRDFYYTGEAGFSLQIIDPIFVPTYWYYDSKADEWQRRSD